MSAAGGAAPARVQRPAWERLPLLILGFVALFSGLGAGLARLGWTMPAFAAGAAALHGPLMICGFFGVVIALERAVAIGRPWAYAAPLLAGLGSAAALHGATVAAPWLYLAASAVLLAASLDVLRRQREGFTLVITLAAGCWVVGAALWALGAQVYQVVGWWLAFLVLTIAGERLELSRFMPPARNAARVFAGIVALALAALLAWPWPGAAQWFGAALLGLAAWLARQDIARRTVRQRGLTRFIAVCLLSGYFWLAVGGLVIAVAGLAPGSAAYDAALHALLLGFVFSMVFGHAPIIFPAVLRVSVPYTPWFYAPLALLHASLLLRVAGDAAGSFELTRWGGLLSALALVAFIANTLAAVLRGRRAGGGEAGRGPRLLAVLAVVAVVFGLATVASGGLALFGGPAARAAAGASVGFVLWFNFCAGFAYVAAGFGLWWRRRWAMGLALGIALATALVGIAFAWHVMRGGAYETRTVGALALRLGFWAFTGHRAWRALGTPR